MTTELGKLVAGIGLQVEELLGADHPELVDEKYAVEFESGGQWATKSLLVMFRAAEHQVPPLYPEFPSPRRPAATRTPLPGKMTPFGFNESIRDVGRGLLAIELLSAQLAIEGAYDDGVGKEHRKLVFVAQALVEGSFMTLRRLRWDNTLG